MKTNREKYDEAIAEAKLISKSAMTNARNVLEESLEPHLKDMIVAKLQEMEEDEDEYMEEEIAEEDENEDEVDAEDDSDESEDDAEVDDEADSEEDMEDMDSEEDTDIEDMTVADLENLIRDLIAQETGAGMEEPEIDLDGEEDLGGDLDGLDVPGAGDMVATTDDEYEDEESLEELLMQLERLAEGELEDKDTVDEEEAVEKDKKPVKEQDDMENDSDVVQKKLKTAKAELREANKTIDTLRTELSEINLMNSKLLYVNKLFKSKNLSENEKVHILTTFDKAETVKESKLIFEAIQDMYSDKKGIGKRKKSPIKEHRSFASKATGVAPKKPVIKESKEDEQVQRWQKLAGIIKE